MIYLIPFLSCYFVQTGIPFRLSLWKMQLINFLDWSNKKTFPGRFRPFDCEYCLAFWLTICYSLFIGNIGATETIILSGFNGMISIFIMTILNKLK